MAKQQQPKKAGDPAAGTSAKKEPKAAAKPKTAVKEVKVEKDNKDPRPLSQGQTFLFIRNGEDVYYTKSVADVMLTRDPGSIVIPKGSPYVPPKGLDCDGC